MTVLPFLPEPEDRGLFGIIESLLGGGLNLFGSIPASLIDVVDSVGEMTVGEALAAVSQMRLKDVLDFLGGDN